MSAVFQIKSSVIHERFDDETVIVNLDTGCYYNLQTSANAIWSMLAAGYSEQVIIDRACGLYRGDAASVAAATRAFIEKLLSENLVERAEGTSPTALSASAEAAGDFVEPVLQKYTDMEELLLLDPIHEVDKLGWPSAKQKSA